MGLRELFSTTVIEYAAYDQEHGEVLIVLERNRLTQRTRQKVYNVHP